MRQDSRHASEIRRLFDELRQAHQRAAAAVGDGIGPGAGIGPEFTAECGKAAQIVARIRALDRL